MPYQESEDRGVALNTGTRPGRGKRAGDPRVAVLPVDAEHVGLVHTELRRRDRVNAVAIPEMSEQPLRNWLVVHSRTETVEFRQRFGVTLPSLLGVAPDNLLEAGVLGHDMPPRDTLVPQRRGERKMACDIDDREGESPSPMESRLGRMFHSSATGRRREQTLPEAPGRRQAARTRDTNSRTARMTRRRATAPERAPVQDPQAPQPPGRAHVTAALSPVGAATDPAGRIARRRRMSVRS